MLPQAPHRRARAAAAIAVALLLACPPGHAADPVRYTLSIAPSGDAAVDAALPGISTLRSLRETAPAGPLALIARARADAARFMDALHSLGHYAGTVSIRIDNIPVDAPDLADRLDALPQDAQAAVSVAVAVGPVFTLGRVRVRGDVPAGAEAALGLHPGQPAIAADVLAGGERLRTALRAAGYALARVPPPDAVLVPGGRTLDITFQVDAGPRVDLGPITFKGLDRLSERAARDRLGLKPGTRFDPARIAAARADLAALPAVGSVRIVEAGHTDAQGRLPLEVDVAERKRRAIRLEGAWSTDQGGSVSAAWTHRNLFGNGEQFTVSAAAIELGGSANRAPGYVANTSLTLPDWQAHGQSLELRLGAAREYLRAYTRTGATAAATLRRHFSGALAASAGLAATQAEIVQEGATRDYTLLQVPLGLVLDTTTDKLDPVSGIRAGLTVTPTVNLGQGTPAFVVVQANAATYLDLGATPGCTVLALRALVGMVEGGGVFDLPPDQRFYAGGSATLRGFRYQSVGKLFPSGRPQGGSAIDAASVELRQRIGASWGMAAFVDAGQIGDQGVPFTGGVRVGAGLGLRYYSGIGPLRLDVAVPVTRQDKTDSFQLYAGIGQAF